MWNHDIGEEPLLDFQEKIADIENSLKGRGILTEAPAEKGPLETRRAELRVKIDTALENASLKPPLRKNLEKEKARLDPQKAVTSKILDGVERALSLAVKK